MTWLRVTLLLLFAFFGVFAEAVFDVPRRWLGGQIDFLPPLIVYAAVTTDVKTVALVSLAGGLWVDALSANPLGVSVLPLFWTGFLLVRAQDLVQRELAYAQSVFGLLASASVALLKLGILLTLGERPLIGWGSLWQLIVVCLGGAALTPLAFRCLHALNGLFAYQPVPSSAFRLDREIKRGRT